MIKYFLFIYSLLFVFLSISAQKPSYKNISIKYVKPPTDPLPKNVKTYYTEILNTIPEIADINGFTIKKIKNIKLRFNGYTKTEESTKAHVLLKMNFHSAKYKSEINKTTTTVKKDGERVEVPAEQLIITSSIKSDILMRDVLNGKDIIVQKDFVSEQIYDTGAMEQIGLAAKILKRDGKKKAFGMYRNMLDKRILDFSDMISEKYGYTVKNVSFKITMGKGKKYDYSNLQQAFDSIKTITKNTRKLFIKDEKSKQKIKNCINIWQNAIAEYEPNTKKAKINDKIIGGLYNNMAIAYFLMKDWEKTYEYSEKGKVYKTSKKRSDYISKFCKNLQSLRTKSPLYN
ncbi:hypothetical protein ACKGJY_09690 [Hyunsoonleella sp. 2307UL5-6]|uniref:hypothetical protein n=1 Tax=Hyunsoonleella sp. 2307UL5-6 TaxID=3384768 RepID=UPI0039BCD5EA